MSCIRLRCMHWVQKTCCRWKNLSTKNIAKSKGWRWYHDAMESWFENSQAIVHSQFYYFYYKKTFTLALEVHVMSPRQCIRKTELGNKVREKAYHLQSLSLIKTLIIKYCQFNNVQIITFDIIVFCLKGYHSIGLSLIFF